MTTVWSFLRYVIERSGRTESGTYAFGTVPALADWVIRLRLAAGEKVTITAAANEQFNEKFIRWFRGSLGPTNLRASYEKNSTVLVIGKDLNG